MIRQLMRLFTAPVCILVLVRPAPAAPDAASIRAEIVTMPLGTSIEIRLTDRQKLRGARGPVTDAGFTFIDARSGERQIAFSDVASVKQIKAKSHTGRNILIGVGIGLGVVAVVMLSILNNGGYF